MAGGAGLDLWPGEKSYRQRKLVQVTHVMRLGTQAVLQSTLQGLGFSGRLNTAFIERVNLTVRHGVAALARRTWATSQQSPYLLAHLEWWRAYYHGCRAPIPRCGWRSYSRENEEASEWRNAIGIVLLRWQREEPTDDGQRTKCSLATCQRFPLERHRSQMGVQGHNGGRWVHVLGVELGWSLTPRSGDLPGLPHHNKPAQNGFGEGSSNYPPYPMAVPPSCHPFSFPLELARPARPQCLVGTTATAGQCCRRSRFSGYELTREELSIKEAFSMPCPSPLS
ncbi:MAG TPA: hypothetical protein VF043_14255 [Ktedonobacteraceae bacterium]